MDSLHESRQPNLLGGAPKTTSKPYLSWGQTILLGMVGACGLWLLAPTGVPKSTNLSTETILQASDQQSIDGMVPAFVQVNGAVLSYAERKGDGDANLPLVLLHGYLDSWKSWTNVMHYFPAGRRVVSLTLRGWGDSAKTGPYTLDAYAEDVVAFLAALGINRCILVGHSMGTLISTAVAARHPDLVAGLILCSAAAKVEPEHVIDPSAGITLRDMEQQVDMVFADNDTISAEGRAFLESFQLGDLKPFVETGAVTQEFEQQVMNETLKATPRSYRDCFHSMLDEDHASELATIDKPVLIIWGTKDGLFDASTQQKLHAALTRASITTRDVHNAPHGVIWTSGPSCAKTMQRWLSALGL